VSTHTGSRVAPRLDKCNFINIQQSHGIAAKGYQVTGLRTGYEGVLAHRTDDLFASSARANGKVVGLDEKSIRIEYEDGKVESIELGRRFGTSGGLTLPHSLVTQFKQGDEIKQGDIVAYNDGFFAPSFFNPKQVNWKAGVMATTALMEAVYTLEDSSAITEELAAELGTTTTKVKVVTVAFNQAVRGLVKPGDKVDLESILCTIEDEVTARNDLFDDQSLDTLRMLSAMTPRAKCVGVVEKVEIFYHGDTDDMSDSLRAIARQGDLERKKMSARMGEPAITGAVDQSFRIEGDGLNQNHMAIRIYISHNVGTGVGDKAVFANQMKTVFGHILKGPHETQTGVKLDAIFGFKSVQDRIVLSPMLIGTTNTLLRVIGEKAAQIYFEN